ncbi:hypothetical protein AB4865_03230 [Capnocytophaga sp. ARDL2]|uniref:hypothetical protein n=1 Tax=Capnocytophaga sp. ARDL2 TaxID=3238809 RepID=UPI003558BDC2
MSKCDWGSWGIEYTYFDSIQLILNNVVRRTYYPTDEGKSIYKAEDSNYWKPVESRKYYNKYVFEITEEDLN